MFTQMTFSLTTRIFASYASLVKTSEFKLMFTPGPATTPLMTFSVHARFIRADHSNVAPDQSNDILRQIIEALCVHDNKIKGDYEKNVHVDFVIVDTKNFNNLPENIITLVGCDVGVVGSDETGTNNERRKRSCGRDGGEQEFKLADFDERSVGNEDPTGERECHLCELSRTKRAGYKVDDADVILCGEEEKRSQMQRRRRKDSFMRRRNNTVPHAGRAPTRGQGSAGGPTGTNGRRGRPLEEKKKKREKEEREK